MNSRLFLLAAALAVLILASGCTSQARNSGSAQDANVTLAFRVYLPEGAIDRNATVAVGSSALGAMEPLFDVGLTQYAGMGKFVTSIEGVSASQSEYWALYVDGQYADRGIELYYPEEDTLFEWRLEGIN